MFKKTLLEASLSVLSFSSIAGNTSFEGMYLGASLNLTNLEADVKNSTTKLDFKNDGLNPGLGLNLGYGALFNKFYLGAEVGAKTGNGKAEYSNGLATIEGNESWDLSILPGFLLNDSTLVYGRVGVGTVNGKAKVPATGYSKSDDFDTTVWGVGFETPVMTNVLGRVEVSSTSFEKKYSSTGEKWSGDATAISVGIQSYF